MGEDGFCLFQTIIFKHLGRLVSLVRVKITAPCLYWSVDFSVNNYLGSFVSFWMTDFQWWWWLCFSRYLDPDMYSMIEDSTNILKSKRFKKLTKSICGLVSILLLSWYPKIHYHFLPLLTQFLFFQISMRFLILLIWYSWYLDHSQYIFFEFFSVGNFGNLLLCRTQDW